MASYFLAAAAAAAAAALSFRLPACVLASQSGQKVCCMLSKYLRRFWQSAAKRSFDVSAGSIISREATRQLTVEIFVEGALVVVLDLSAETKHHGISFARLVAKEESLVANERVDCFHVSASHVVQLVFLVQAVAVHL